MSKKLTLKILTVGGQEKRSTEFVCLYEKWSAEQGETEHRAKNVYPNNIYKPKHEWLVLQQKTNIWKATKDGSGTKLWLRFPC